MMLRNGDGDKKVKELNLIILHLHLFVSSQHHVCCVPEKKPTGRATISTSTTTVGSPSATASKAMRLSSQVSQVQQSDRVGMRAWCRRLGRGGCKGSEVMEGQRHRELASDVGLHCHSVTLCLHSDTANAPPVSL